MEIRKGNIPKILLACPHSKRHEAVFKDWIKHLSKLNYPEFDVCIVDNTLDNGEYYETIKETKIKSKKIISWHSAWKQEEEHYLQMLARIREEIRTYFLEHTEYDSLFFLDDDIFIPRKGIQRLLSYNKDHVGFYVHVFPEDKQMPCILKSGEIIVGKGLPFFSFPEINAYKRYVNRFRKGKLSTRDKNLFPFIIRDEHRPQLLQAYGVNIGCLMIKRSSIEKVPFRTHPTFILGEDIWYFAEANEKKLEFWCDTDFRCEHRNTSWNDVDKSNIKKFKMYVAQGNADATGAEIIEHGE
jgi:hypothetical protein